MSNSTSTTRIRHSLRRWMCHDSGLDADIVEGLWSGPDRLVASGQLLKDGNRSKVVRIESRGKHYVLKRYHRMSLIHTFSHLLLRSRGRWSWNNGLLTLAAGLRAPRPLACVEERLGPLRGHSYFLSEFVEGEMLLELVLEKYPTQSELEPLADQFKTIWQTLGQGRISQGDMKATNFLVDGEVKIWMLDLDGMRKPRTNWWWRRLRAKDKARFMKNWRGRPEAEEVFLACVDTA